MTPRYLPDVLCIHVQCMKDVAPLAHRNGYLVVQANMEFDAFHANMMWEQKWCCMTTNYTHRVAGHHHMFYIPPTPLGARPELPWSVPQYSLPDFCLATHDLPLTMKDEPEFKAIWNSGMHPCIYFRPSNVPTLPEVWTTRISQLQLPVSTKEGWSPFLEPGGPGT